MFFMTHSVHSGKTVRLLASTACLFALAACSDATHDMQDVSASDTPLERAQAVLAQMTLEEKIGQIIQADISAITPEEAKTHNVGSVLNGGNSAPGGGVVASPEDWIALADAFWVASTDTSDGGVGIPLIWGTDAVHGHNNLQNATIFPHNSGLGAMNNSDLIRQIGEVTAREIRATGLDWTFAPTLAVARDDRWGRAYESYSEGPDIVAAYSEAMVVGLQGSKDADDFLVGENVVATAKHFVADGGTYLGVDRGDAKGDDSAVLALHGAGYPPAIDAGAQTVMASFSSINGEKMHGSKRYLTDILRGQMGFDGFVVGDWNGHGFVDGCTPTDCIHALHAGLDMYMAPDSWRGLYVSLLEAAKNGTLDLGRLDEAVTRILTVKFRTGLFDAGLPSKRATSDPSVLGAPEHGDIAQQAVRESLVLLKNSGGALPIPASAKVLVTGSGAHSMQQQTGGWTLSWQGDANANDAFETGETIFEGLLEALEANGGQATLSEDGRFDEKPDYAVVVYGEQPYAEYRGDRSDLVFEFEGDENIALIRSLKEQEIPVVSVFLTGRPLWVNPHLNASDAFVVAWLPGTEGGGVADVLVADAEGNPRNDFKGTLTFSWPENGIGEPINGPEDAGILFPYGYGLNYSGPTDFADLSEDPGIDDIRKSFAGSVINRGDTAPAFQLFLSDYANDAGPVVGLLGASGGNVITVRGTDFKAQEDARTLSWTGEGRGTAMVRSDWAVDVSRIGDVSSLVMRLNGRVDAYETGPFTLSMSCGEACSGSLDLSSFLAEAPTGEWGTMDIPLQCFVEAGLDATSVNTLLVLETSAKAEVSLHSVDILVGDNPGTCPPSAQ